MFTSARHESLAAAQVLALLVAANGRVDMAEIDRLQALQSFARLGVDRDSFVQWAQRCVEDIGAGLCERSWLGTSELLYADALLDAVHNPELRLLVCGLCAGTIAADGVINRDERLLYSHALARWHIQPQEVSQGIHEDLVH
jgi:uncharacterized tellurite resistance protein B-like protein